MRNVKHDRKYNYAWVLQGNYGSRWEDLTAEESSTEIILRLYEYRENWGWGGYYRIVLCRELREKVKEGL